VRSQVRILRVGERESLLLEDQVAREFSLTLILNDRELVTLLCSPADLEQLALGYLLSEGLIEGAEEVERLSLEKRRGTVRIWTKGRPSAFSQGVIGSGGGRGLWPTFEGIKPVTSELHLTPMEALELSRQLQRRSEAFRATAGVHSAALCDRERILVFKEDIGRHNALDKVFGECLLKGTSTVDGIMAMSGRISSEMLLKVARRRVPVIISRAAPTDLAVKLARRLGIALIGFARGRRMNVYAGGWRLGLSGV